MKTIKNLIVTVLLITITNYSFSNGKNPKTNGTFERKISSLLNLSSVSNEQKAGSKVAVKVQMVDHKLRILDISGNNTEFENYVAEKINQIDIKDAQSIPNESFIIKVNLK